jgi:hypothetical protein
MFQHKAAFKKEAAGKKRIILNTSPAGIYMQYARYGKTIFQICCTDIVEQPPRSFQD